MGIHTQIRIQNGKGDASTSIAGARPVKNTMTIFDMDIEEAENRGGTGAFMASSPTRPDLPLP
jgi:hypothetical protein